MGSDSGIRGSEVGRSRYRDALPQLDEMVFLTDSGIETDLIFCGGWDLPEFASFPLLDDPRGVAALERYYFRHLDIAEAFHRGMILEAVTWRASRDWGERLGYSSRRLRAVNQRAIDMLVAMRDGREIDIVVSGCIGPRADAYQPNEVMSADAAADYHREQIDVFAATAADLVHAMTITYAAEAVGIVRAAVDADVPVVISFTTETDGRLPDGTSLAEAIETVENATQRAALYYGVNCAHPTHFVDSFPADPALASRLRSLRANASVKSHAELDEADELDTGDPVDLADRYRRLRVDHPQLTILGGCCGTDVRHVEAIARACC